MVIATPWLEDPHAFYYNQKINCMCARGKVEFDGEIYTFDPATDYGALDWGRGVWTYDNTWYWGSGSGTVDGHRFGFNIGYGFGDTSAASENILFYDGVGHKLDDVTFLISDNYTDPWKFTSSDGRFEMDFVPIIDRAALLDVKLICSDQHQVFGRMSGTAVLDDGTKTMPCAINVVTDEPGRTVMEMTLKEGKNREIRRMCESVGLEVVRLKRNAEGVVKLGMLKPGTYRELTKAEVNGLRAAAVKGRAQTRSAAQQSKAAERRPRGPVGKNAPRKQK